MFFSSECSKRPVHGFLLDGFHMNGPASELLNWDEIQPVLVDCVRLLPVDKPRFFFGAARPELVFQLLGAGVDVFDCSYPCLVTEREAALVFPNREQSQADQEDSLADVSAPAQHEMCMKGTGHR